MPAIGEMSQNEDPDVSPTRLEKVGEFVHSLTKSGRSTNFTTGGAKVDDLDLIGVELGRLLNWSAGWLGRKRQRARRASILHVPC